MLVVSGVMCLFALFVVDLAMAAMGLVGDTTAERDAVMSVRNPWFAFYGGAGIVTVICWVLALTSSFVRRWRTWTKPSVALSLVVSVALILALPVGIIWG